MALLENVSVPLELWQRRCYGSADKFLAAGLACGGIDC